MVECQKKGEKNEQKERKTRGTEEKEEKGNLLFPGFGADHCGDYFAYRYCYRDAKLQVSDKGYGFGN